MKLNHLARMTDDTGMLQHAVFAVPNQHEGYTTDDNARALIVSILVEQLGGDGEVDAKKLGFAIPGFSLARLQLRQRKVPQLSEL